MKITFAGIGHGESDRTLQAFEDVLRPGVKMVALSHVLYTTGAVLPVAEVTEMAHSVGSVVLETGTLPRPAVAGFAEALAWLREDVGLDGAYADISLLSQYYRERAAGIPGATVLSPPGQPSGLVAVHIGDRDTFLAVEYLLEAGVLTRNIHENNALRLSTGFYNTEEDVDLALGKIYEFMKR